MLDKNGFRKKFLRSDFLINLRRNLRQIIGIAVEKELKKLNTSSLNYLNKGNLTNNEKKKNREIDNKIMLLLSDWSNSICYCPLCKSTSMDMLFFPLEKKWYCKKHARRIVDVNHGFKTRRNSKYIFKIDDEYEDEGFIQLYLDPKKCSMPKPFVLNKFLTVKFEDGYRTVIYIEGKEFIQCTYLLLNIPDEEIRDLREFDSVDETAEFQRLEMESGQEIIPPDVEFWGHCSSLQAWYENSYDSRLLHRNIAFPLLKKLTEVGDPLAKKVFKEEIAKRYKSGFPSVVKYLEEEGYLKYLSKEELEALK